MANDYERSRLFTRRAFMLGGAKIGLFTILMGRIYYLQVIQGTKYTTLAEENRINLRLLAPPRGQILDRNGAALAINQQNYRVVLLPEQIDELDPLFDGINRFVPLSDNDRKRVMRDLKNNSSLNAVLVRDNLTWDQVATLSIHNLELPGVDIEVGAVRSYPYNEATSHILGYIGAVSESEMDDDEPILSIPGFRIGKSGVEKQYDNSLRGTAGTVQMEVDAHGRVVRELARNEPQIGQDLKLSIDIGLQQFAVQKVSEVPSAAAIVIDLNDGGIRALVSHPGFDPNLFTYGISQDDWDRLNNDEHTPMLNKAVGGVYAPGSTFKPIVALAALEAGIMKPQDTVTCPGYYELGNHKFHCWKHGGHGTVNLMTAMAGSCDTYFYDLGKRTGIDRMQAMAKRFGFGGKLGVDMPHERAGLIPGRLWKMANKAAGWQLGETLIAAIGQGYTTVSPLQLGVMAARIASGKSLTPHMILNSNNIEMPSMGLNPDHLQIVRQAMWGVVNSTAGTAYAARITDASKAMAGKTGTAQVRRITIAERAEGVTANEDLPWKERDHALFAGFAPFDNPRYAVSILIEHGGSGAHVAAPLARDLLLEAQKRES